ncbi:MAG: hypothetical protein ABIP35_03345 [Ginsengibacter sp.]
MKRIKLFLLTVAIAGAGSAFIPAGNPPGDVYILDGSTFKLKSTQEGSCRSQNPSVCNYTLKEIHGSEPYVLSDFNYDPNEQKIWTPATP